MRHREDAELARAMGRGHEAAFRKFFDDYFPRVYRFCCRRVDETMAEDVAQTVLINAVRNIAGYRGDASLFTWLCQIARNEIGAEFRRPAAQMELLPLDQVGLLGREVESIESPDDPFERRMSLEQSRQVHAVLDELPGDYGRVLELKYSEGHSVEEIALRLRVTPIAVQSLLARARQAFRLAWTASLGVGPYDESGAV